jgi:hypothetical protein
MPRESMAIDRISKSARQETLSMRCWALFRRRGIPSTRADQTSGISYSPLAHDAKETRLLHLLPGDETADIHCQLHTVSLDSDPDYEALSYTWSAPTETSLVTVDGQELPIRRNLQRALRRFRRRDVERVLWADAICIDQSSIVERNQQVSMMADIYRKCSQCLVWPGVAQDSLGEMDATRGHVFRILDTAASFHQYGSDLVAVESNAHLSRNRAQLIEILLSVRQRQCSDPRDNIFEVLSLVRDWAERSAVQADYSKSREAVLRSLQLRW